MISTSIRVAHLAETMNMGGLEKLLVEFARHADRSRFSLRFIALGEPGHLAGEIQELGWPVTAFHAAPGLRSRLALVPKLVALLLRERIDVVHTHSEGPLFYGGPAARFARVRRVIHTRHHGPDLGSSRRRLAALAFAARFVDRVICVADDGARNSVREGVAASKVATIWNGIDLSRFAYAGPQPGGPAVIVARLIAEKDHATLLRATALAAQRDPDFRLEIAGDGPCFDDLMTLTRSLGIERHVRFLGRVDDVPALLERAGLLVLSSWLEGISLTLLEAMARGLPVVATNVGGNPEVVVDGETGVLVPSRSPEALADAMLAVRANHALARRLGRAGRERAEQWFDVRRMIARYETLYLDREGSPSIMEDARNLLEASHT